MKERTEEHKKKLREAVKASWKDPNSTYNKKEYRQKLSDSHRTDKQRKRQSDLMKEINKKMWNNPNSRVNSKEYRENLSRIKTGLHNSEETKKIIGEKARQKWADPNSKYNSPEHRKRLSEQHSDPNSVFQSEEYKRKISIANTGKKHSEEAKIKHSLATSGNKHPIFGKHLKLETKEKTGKKIRELWKNKDSIFNNKKYRKNLSESLSGENHPYFGISLPEEQKLKQHNTMIKHWEDPNSVFNSEIYKQNRKEMFKKHKDTEPELIVKNILNKLKIHYIPQEMIYPYFADFYIPSCNLIIEVDGTYSHGDPRKFGPNDIIQGNKKAKDKWASDKIKNKFLESLGYNILRFWEKEIKKEPKLIEELIKISIIKNS